MEVKRWLASLWWLALMLGVTPAWPADTPAPSPAVVLATDRGDIRITLFADKAPLTVANFLMHVDSGFYDGTIFHRAIPHFIIQGGGFLPGMQEKTPLSTVVNESRNRLSNRKWTVAMARTDDPNSAGSQFFVNLANNVELDYRFGKPGYAVFGEVTEGGDLLEQAAREPTTSRGPYADVPVTPLVILHAHRVTGTDTAP